MRNVRGLLFSEGRMTARGRHCWGVCRDPGPILGTKVYKHQNYILHAKCLHGNWSTCSHVHYRCEKTWRIEWTWISRHRDFWILIMEGLPSVIPKSIVEVLNRLENDEDNLFSWKLTRSQDKFSLTVSCKLPAKTFHKPRTTTR